VESLVFGKLLLVFQPVSINVGRKLRNLKIIKFLKDFIMKRNVFFIGLMVSIFCGYLYSQSFSIYRTKIPKQWQEDLRFLSDKIKEIHPQPFSKTSIDSFSNSVNTLHDRIPTMSDNEIIVGLFRIVSLINDGHTRIHGKKLTDLWFPIRVEMFSDGLFITATSKQYANAIGAKVLRIGKHSAEESFEKIEAIAPHDNEYSQIYMAPGYITMASILNGLHIIDDLSYLYLLIDKDGKVSELKVVSNEYDSDNELSWYWLLNSVPANDFVRFMDQSKEKLPLYLNNFEQFYWFKLLDKTKTVYMCFNLCADSENEKFSDFNTRLWNFIDKNNANKLIIDLRNNIGGNNQILMPLIYSIIRHDKINNRGYLYVIIGRKTWSASMHCATWLDRHTNAIFVGEPTGSAPNHFADPEVIFLPHSNLMLMVSKYYWQNSWPWDSRPWIEPDTLVTLSSYDYFKYHDPVLEAIINLQKASIEK